MSFQDRAWPFRHARVAVASRPCGAAEKRPCFSSSWKNIPDLQTPPTRMFELPVQKEKGEGESGSRCFRSEKLGVCWSALADSHSHLVSTERQVCRDQSL